MSAMCFLNVSTHGRGLFRSSGDDAQGQASVALRNITFTTCQLAVTKERGDTRIICISFLANRNFCISSMTRLTKKGTN